MSDLKELIEREMESFIEWDGDDKSIVTTTSAKLFAEHVAGLWADHVAGARNMVAAVQGEPARHDWDEQDKCRRCGDRDWYAGPICTPKQPAEQQPIPSSLAYDASIHLTNWLNMNLCECEGGHTCGYTEVRRTRDALLAVAEQQPDTTQPVEHQFPSSYPVSGNVYFRDSTGEWVLEITASINGTRCTARHVQPAGTRPEDVVGLPALYESTPDITKLVEAQESAKNLIANHSGEVLPDEYAGDQIEQIDAALAASRKGGEV